MLKLSSVCLLLLLCVFSVNCLFAVGEDGLTTSSLNSPQFNGMWMWGSYMNRTNLTDIKAHGINNIIVHEDIFTRNSPDDALNWINEANSLDIKVHIWIQCFYKDGSWVKPVLENGSYNRTRFNEIIDKAVNYSKIANVSGIHLDYLRYPGTAYRATGGYMNACNAIAELTSEVNSRIKGINPNIISSAAIMPEYEDVHYYNETMPDETNADAYYYGQDIGQLGNILDYIIPMVYKGNYNKDSSWIGYTTKWFVDNSPKAKIIIGLQGYVSDDDPTPLPSEELSNDAYIALNNGAYGICIFRYGLFNYINWDSSNNNVINNTENSSSLANKNDSLNTQNYVEDSNDSNNRDSSGIGANSDLSDMVHDSVSNTFPISRTGFPLLFLLFLLICSFYSWNRNNK